MDEYGLPALIKYYKNGRALGTPENWNEAIRKASGEYIKILHHDDWFSSTESLLKYVSLLDENPESDFVFAATKAIAPGLQQWEHVITDADVTALQSNPLLLYRNNFIGAPSTVMFRKRSFLPFDNNLKWLVDVDQYIRMIDDNKNIRYSSETLVVTCLPEGRVSDDCKDNKAVEVYEYLYLLNAFCNRKKNYDPAELRSCF